MKDGNPYLDQNMVVDNLRSKQYVSPILSQRKTAQTSAERPFDHHTIPLQTDFEFKEFQQLKFMRDDDPETYFQKMDGRKLLKFRVNSRERKIGQEKRLKSKFLMPKKRNF